LVGEALAAGRVQEILVTAEAEATTWRVRAPDIPVTVLPSGDLERIADARSPQNVLALGPLLPLDSAENLLANSERVLLLDGVQDPGNCGSLLRSAAAFGVQSVLWGEGTPDRAHPRLLRASAGAVFRLGMAAVEVHSISALARRTQHTILLPHVKGGQELASVSVPRRWILVAGSEGRGASLDDKAALKLTIPMARGVESLNVGAALAVILAHLARRD
jgi:TrmH family RNA methyltransferase